MIQKNQKQPANQSSQLRGTISDITAELINELKEMDLNPMEKIALLRTLLPYSVGKLPTALVNFSLLSGQPTSARVIELSGEGGI
jgi:hypothetical protein